MDIGSEQGGLFEINDLTYTFFKEIEIKVRYLLITAFQKKSSDNREEIIKAVTDSDDKVLLDNTIH